MKGLAQTSVTDGFVSGSEAIDRIGDGGMVVAVDGSGRGCVVAAALHATSAVVNFMVREAGGLVCLALPPERCDELELAPIGRRSIARLETDFMVSVGARHGVTTGSSAHDRARTIQVAIDPDSVSHDLVRPGHVFPIRARAGGVLERSALPEAAMDLARLAGLKGASVLCEILDEDGEPAEMQDLRAFCAEYDLVMVDVDVLAARRDRTDGLVRREVTAVLPTSRGDFQIVGYRDLITGAEHVALIKGAVSVDAHALVRIHRSCVVGEAFRGLRCNCRSLLVRAMDRIEAEGTGAIVYLGNEPGSDGVISGIGGYALSVEPARASNHRSSCAAGGSDARALAIGAQILRDVGCVSLRLLEPDLMTAASLAQNGIHVSEIIGAADVE